jgi:hypothetical protein
MAVDAGQAGGGGQQALGEGDSQPAAGNSDANGSGNGPGRTRRRWDRLPPGDIFPLVGDILFGFDTRSAGWFEILMPRS